MTLNLRTIKKPAKTAKILYLTYDGLCDPLGQSQILSYMVGLSKRGHSILIVSFEKSSNFENHSAEIRQECEKHQIQWVPELYHKSPPILSTLYDLLRLRFIASRLLRKIDFDIVHCRSYLTSLIGLWIKRKFGTRFIFDMRGFWADERIDGGIWDIENGLYRQVYSFFKRKEIEFLIKADGVITLTHEAGKVIKEWFQGDLVVTGSVQGRALEKTNRWGQRILRSQGISQYREWPGSKITVIPTCVDEKRFNLPTGKVTELEMELGISKDDFVLLYLGSLGTWYLLPEMLDFFAHLRKVSRSAKFLIITRDDPKSILTEQAARPVQDGLIIRGLPHSRVPELGSLVNAGICFIKPSFSKKASSPTKIGEMLALGIPVISNQGYGDVDETINSECGFIIQKFLPQEYARTIENLEKVKFDALRVRSRGLEFFSLRDGIQKYNAVYQNILSLQSKPDRGK